MLVSLYQVSQGHYDMIRPVYDKKDRPDAISDFTIWINWLKIWFAKIVFFYIITLIKN